ncbi:MAG TPA: class GN sortase [Burkholderiaceae bacterium]|nr:class GN sortase [Burkholderiaceae bacterium]HRA78474.1 class GN sortase [Burkholderiaceae bacterium]
MIVSLRSWLLDRRIDLRYAWLAVRRRLSARRLIVAALVAAGLWQLGAGLSVHAKAWLAQALIEQAWRHNRSEGRALARPWAWADTTAVARITFVGQARSMIVLAGDSGRVLAFGPGHRTGTTLPGEAGNSVISGHRDTHFRVLERVVGGERIEVERLDGRRRVYRVSGARIVERGDLGVVADRGLDELTLVTCWPFDAVAPGGPLRYVVSAVADGDA